MEDTKANSRAFSEVSVPHPGDERKRDLPHEKAIHPPEGELDELGILLYQVLR